jgi:hypothetical protein
MTGQAADQDELRTIIRVLRDQVSYLQEVIRIREEEIRRHQHLLAAALERVPAIEEAPSEQRELPVLTPSGVKGNGDVPPELEERSWWRRLFGGYWQPTSGASNARGWLLTGAEGPGRGYTKARKIPDGGGRICRRY